MAKECEAAEPEVTITEKSASVATCTVKEIACAEVSLQLKAGVSEMKDDPLFGDDSIGAASGSGGSAALFVHPKSIAHKHAEQTTALMLRNVMVPSYDLKG